MQTDGSRGLKRGRRQADVPVSHGGLEGDYGLNEQWEAPKRGCLECDYGRHEPSSTCDAAIPTSFPRKSIKSLTATTHATIRFLEPTRMEARCRTVGKSRRTQIISAVICRTMSTCGNEQKPFVQHSSIASGIPGISLPKTRLTLVSLWSVAMKPFPRCGRSTRAAPEASE